MSQSTAAPAVQASGLTVAIRLLGWGNLGILAAFLVNNMLINAAGFPGAALVSSGTGGLAWLQLALYAVGLLLAVWYVLSRRETMLRSDAERITRINNFVIRWAFWMVVIVGIADLAISFLRVEDFLSSFVGDDITRSMGLSHYRGLYVHVPLILLSLVIAIFARGLNFIWLGLMIVVAELLIVVGRFVFSYEQAFMADLVRFWYGAFFLFASAYTLTEEGHVRVDVLYAGFSNKTKGMVNALGSLFMGILFCWTILIVGMGSKSSIINSPVFNFEVTQSTFGLYVKYLMAAFLGIFAISMMIQFSAYLMAAVADWRGDPGRVERDSAHVA